MRMSGDPPPHVDCWVRISGVEELSENKIVCYANIVDDAEDDHRGGLADTPASQSGGGDPEENGEPKKKRTKYSPIFVFRTKEPRLRITGPAPIAASPLVKLKVRLVDEFTPGTANFSNMPLSKFCTAKRVDRGPRGVNVVAWLEYEWAPVSAKYKTRAATAFRIAVDAVKRTESSRRSEAEYKDMLRMLTNNPARIRDDHYRISKINHVMDGISVYEGGNWDTTAELASLWGRKETLYLMETPDVRRELYEKLKLTPELVIFSMPDPALGMDFGIDPTARSQGLLRFWNKYATPELFDHDLDLFQEVHSAWKPLSDACHAGGYAMAFGYISEIKDHFEILSKVMSFFNLRNVYGGRAGSWISDSTSKDRLVPIERPDELRNGSIIMSGDAYSMFQKTAAWVHRARSISVWHTPSWDMDCISRCTNVNTNTCAMFNVDRQTNQQMLLGFENKLSRGAQVVICGAHLITEASLTKIIDRVDQKCSGLYDIIVTGTAGSRQAPNGDSRHSQRIEFMNSMCELASQRSSLYVIERDTNVLASTAIRAYVMDRPLMSDWDAPGESARDVMWIRATGSRSVPAGTHRALMVNKWAIHRNELSKIESLCVDKDGRTPQVANGHMPPFIKLSTRFKSVQNLAGMRTIIPTQRAVVRTTEVIRPQSICTNVCKHLPGSVFASIGMHFASGEEIEWTTDELCRAMSMASKKIYVAHESVNTNEDAKEFLQKIISNTGSYDVAPQFSQGNLLAMLVNEYSHENNTN